MPQFASQNTGSEHRFDAINAGYRSVFEPARLSLGLVVPIEAYPNHAVPDMRHHIDRALQAEQLGFKAIWLRDVPFNVPAFGDAGQGFDPFAYLGFLAGRTEHIALGVASVILPLRHPAHVAKAAATADALSNGRLILGIASGDRPEEYPALGIPFADRGRRFREAYDYLRAVGTPSPSVANSFGQVHPGLELLPQPSGERLPLLLTGSSQQDPDWVATHADGWMTYPRAHDIQARLIDDYRHRIHEAGLADKPVMEPLYIDLLADDDAEPRSIHLGLRLGVNGLIKYLRSRESIGVNHIALNLRFSHADIDDTLATLAERILPHFH
ncbi:MAG: LLM class oxidoreductase [Pseudomonadota bacterium]